jgi:hypothetical protein
MAISTTANEYLSAPPPPTVSRSSASTATGDTGSDISAWANPMIDRAADTTNVAPSAFAPRETRHGDVAMVGVLAAPLVEVVAPGALAALGLGLFGLLNKAGLNLSHFGLGSRELSIDDPNIQWARPLPSTAQPQRASSAPVTVNSIVSAMQAVGLSPTIAAHLKAELTQLQARSPDAAAFAANLRASPQLMGLALARSVLKAAGLPASPLALSSMTAQMQTMAGDPQQAIAFSNQLAGSSSARNAFATKTFQQGVAQLCRSMSLTDKKIVGQFAAVLRERAGAQGQLPYQYLSNLMSSSASLAQQLANPQSALFTALAAATAKAYNLPVQSVSNFMSQRAPEQMMSAINALGSSPQVLAALRDKVGDVGRWARRRADRELSRIPGKLGEHARRREATADRRAETDAKDRLGRLPPSEHGSANNVVTSHSPNPQPSGGGGGLSMEQLFTASAGLGITNWILNKFDPWEALKAINANRLGGGASDVAAASLDALLKVIPNAPPEFAVFLKNNELWMPKIPNTREVLLAGITGKIDGKPSGDQIKLLGSYLARLNEIQSGTSSNSKENSIDKTAAWKILPYAAEIGNVLAKGLQVYKEYKPQGVTAVPYLTFLKSPQYEHFLYTKNKSDFTAYVNQIYSNFRALKFEEIDMVERLLTLHNMVAIERKVELVKNRVESAYPDLNAGVQVGWKGSMQRNNTNLLIDADSKKIIAQYEERSRAVMEVNQTKLPGEVVLTGQPENIAADIATQEAYVRELQSAVERYRTSNPGLSNLADERLKAANSTLERLRADQRAGISGQKDRDQTSFNTESANWNNKAIASYPNGAAHWTIDIGGKMFTIPYRAPRSNESDSQRIIKENEFYRTQALNLYQTFSVFAGTNGLPDPFDSKGKIFSKIQAARQATRTEQPADSDPAPRRNMPASGGLPPAGEEPSYNDATQDAS